MFLISIGRVNLRNKDAEGKPEENISSYQYKTNAYG